MQLMDFFDKGVERFPDRPLLVDGQRVWSYRQMDELIAKIASALIRRGLKPGHKVAVYSPNHAMAFAGQYGAIRAGALWVPINHRNTAAATIESLDAMKVDWLFFHSSLEAAAQQAKASVPSLTGLTCVDQDLSWAPALEEWADLAEALAEFPRRNASDPVAILMSSGTTGKPKGILLSNRAFTTMIASFDAMLPVEAPPVHLVVAPLSHAAGIYAMALFAHGGTNVLQHKAEPGAILEALAATKASTIFLPPTIIYMLLAHPTAREHDYSSLRSLLYGAAPMSVDKLMEAVALFGPVLAQGYGQSEALMACAFLSARDHVQALAEPGLQHRLRSAGREGPLVRLAVMSDEGKLLPVGEKGEIVARGDIVMDAYFENPEATRDAQAFGWHHTGDIGFKDADGFVYVVDRKKEMIISGGFNVYPGEVEQALMGHPSVKDCAVVGVPDDKWGEAVLAAVELRPGHALDEAALIAFCKERLGSVKAPKRVTQVPELPRSAVGKVLRREVRAPYWAGRERKI
jgi:acyl-CoA synthetase (AMP-forming)/AMP-acid ligase II